MFFIDIVHDIKCNSLSFEIVIVNMAYSLTDQDEINFYSHLVSAGITVRDKFSNNMPARNRQIQCFDFAMITDCLNEDRETEYVFRMICNLLSINESHSKYGFKLNDGEQLVEKSRQSVLSEFFEDLILMLCQCSKIRMILGNYMKNGR